MANPWEEYGSQEPEPPSVAPWEEYAPKSPYIYIPPEDGKNETILLEQTGETVTAPAGTGGLIQSAQGDDIFAPAPSTWTDETVATFEKQAAYATFMAWGYGLVSDEAAAEMIAERSKALAYAQKNYPDYMKQFNEDYENADFFGKFGVLASNPSAVIRSNVAQSPNGLISWAGFLTGAGVGSFFGPAGTTVGGFSGRVTGGALANTAMRMDEILQQQGVDMTDAVAIYNALKKPETRENLVQTATASGLSQSVVESLFDTIAGKYIKGLEKSTLGQKLVAGAKEMGVQAVGEGTGEATGQMVAYGKIDPGDVLLEMATTIPQGAGDVALNVATSRKVDPEMNAVAKEIGTIEAEKQKAIVQQKKIIRKGGDDSEIRQTIVDLDRRREEATKRLAEIALQRDEQKDALAGEQKPEDKSPEIREGRIKKLTDDIKPIERQLDLLEAEFLEKFQKGEDATSVERAINKLMEKKGQIEYELEVMRDEGLSKPENLAKKDITVKGADIINQEKKSARKRADAIVKGFKQGIERARTDIKEAQQMIIDLVKDSGLGREAVGLFEKEILSADTPEKAMRRLPKVQEKVVGLLDQRLREDTVGKIKKAVKRASKSRVIDIGFAQRVQAAVSDIDFTKRTKQTQKKLQSAMDFYKKNTDKKPPKKLLKKLELLGKKQSGEMTTTELLGVLEEITSLIRKGKKKQSIKAQAAKNRLNQRLTDLQGSRTIRKFHVGRAGLGKRLSVIQQMKNGYAEVANRVQSVRISKNSMDVFFDMLDGAVKYTGPAHRIFKKTMDKAFNKYLTLRDDISKEVQELTKKNKYTQENFDRIGAYAALMQENGRDKLKGAGYTDTELSALVLDEKEKALYDAMRKALEKLYPKVSSVMADVYNQDVKKVDNYFPFLTDFTKDAGKDISEIINRMVEPDVRSNKKQKNVNKDFTIERKGGEKAIKIDAMKIFMQHVDNASYLVEMARDIKELAELAGKKDFQDTVGDTAQEFILDWLDLLAKKGRNPDAIGVVDALRKNTGLAVLAYRISSIAIQTTALLEGAALVGGSYVSRGVSAIGFSRNWRKFVYENMPEVRDRIGDDPFWETMGGDGVLKKAQEAGMYGIKKLDHLCAAAVAAGAYMRAVEAKGGKVDFSKPDADALLEAQLYMRRTQSSAFAKDTPLLFSQGKLSKAISERGGSSSWDKLIFQFQSFLFNRWSIISHDLFRTSGIKPTAQSLNIATFLILANMAEYGIRQGSQAAIEGMWSAMGMGAEPPDEGEEEGLLEASVNQALSNVPFVSSFVRSLDYGQPPVPALSLLDRGYDEMQYATRSKDPDKAWRHYMNAIAIIGGGAALGIPGSSQTPAITKALMSEDEEGWQ